MRHGIWWFKRGSIREGTRLSSDYSDLLRILSESGVRFLVVGGYAVMEYAEPRYTKDLDLLIATDEANATAVFNCLKKFGAPLLGIRPEHFQDPELLYQMGSPPARVDVLMSLPGIGFEEAWEARKLIHLFGVEVPVISREHLIEVKRTSDRHSDRADLEALLEDN